ncbi:MAG TPA: hypothetical protein VFO94_20530 [Gammaproteobacteria bacterium]|nr:hypothetical protein [Gammaproteobacteria bacterium]
MLGIRRLGVRAWEADDGSGGAYGRRGKAHAFDGWLKRIMVTTWLEELRRRKIVYEVELAPGNDPRVHRERHHGAAAAGSAEGDRRLFVTMSFRSSFRGKG